MIILFYSLICVQLAKTTLILKRMEYYWIWLLGILRKRRTSTNQ